LHRELRPRPRHRPGATRRSRPGDLATAHPIAVVFATIGAAVVFAAVGFAVWRAAPVTRRGGAELDRQRAIGPAVGGDDARRFETLHRSVGGVPARSGRGGEVFVGDFDPAALVRERFQRRGDRAVRAAKLRDSFQGEVPRSPARFADTLGGVPLPLAGPASSAFMLLTVMRCFLKWGVAP